MTDTQEPQDGLYAMVNYNPRLNRYIITLHESVETHQGVTRDYVFSYREMTLSRRGANRVARRMIKTERTHLAKSIEWTVR